MSSYTEEWPDVGLVSADLPGHEPQPEDRRDLHGHGSDTGHNFLSSGGDAPRSMRLPLGSSMSTRRYEPARRTRANTERCPCVVAESVRSFDEERIGSCGHKSVNLGASRIIARARANSTSSCTRADGLATHSEASERSVPTVQPMSLAPSDRSARSSLPA